MFCFVLRKSDLKFQIVVIFIEVRLLYYESVIKGIINKMLTLFKYIDRKNAKDNSNGEKKISEGWCEKEMNCLIVGH